MDNCEDICPARTGPGLKHAHSNDCQHGHSAMYCCECFGQFQHLSGCRHDREARIEPPVPEVTQIEPVNVSERLASLGISTGSTDLAPECIIDHASLADWSPCGRCGVAHEPKMATGVPAGPAYGPGRSWYGNGELSPRDKMRLTFLIEHTVRREVA